MQERIPVKLTSNSRLSQKDWEVLQANTRRSKGLSFDHVDEDEYAIPYNIDSMTIEGQYLVLQGTAYWRQYLEDGESECTAKVPLSEVPRIGGFVAYPLNNDGKGSKAVRDLLTSLGWEVGESEWVGSPFERD